MCASTGWTWGQVEHGLDLPRARALLDHYRTCPPAHIQLRRIAAFLGLEQTEAPAKPAAPTTAELTDDQVRALMGAGLPSTFQAPNDPMLDFVRD